MRTQAIHKAVRDVFVTNADLVALFGGRLSNTRLPTDIPRPYCVLKIINSSTLVYTRGSINDYIIDLKIYTTEGSSASEISNKVDAIITIIQILNIEGAKIISCLPTTATDELDPDLDLGQDVLINEMYWIIKIFEPNRLTPTT